MSTAWPITLPAPSSQKLSCPYCDGNGHRCDQCDGDGFLLAEDMPEQTQEPKAEWMFL